MNENWFSNISSELNGSWFKNISKDIPKYDNVWNAPADIPISYSYSDGRINYITYASSAYQQVIATIP